MKWLAVNIETTHEAAELITDFLSGLGADGVQVEDAEEIRELLNRPDSLAYADEGYLSTLDEAVRIRAYFAEFDGNVRRNRDISLSAEDLYDDAEKVLVQVSDLESLIADRLAGFSQYLDVGRGYVGCEQVDEEDWAQNWKQYYQTLHLSERLVINPSWIEYDPKPGEIVISLDPGSAFGTGTHETTAMCAQLLDDYLASGASVLDLGSGSGILAIAASKLGAGRVEAIDIDQMAVDVAVENCRINAVEVNCHQGELRDARSAPYDLIIANIIADVIAALAPDVPKQLAPNGLWLVSGIIEDKFDLVLESAQKNGFELVERRERRDWCAAVLRLA